MRNAYKTRKAYTAYAAAAVATAAVTAALLPAPAASASPIPNVRIVQGGECMWAEPGNTEDAKMSGDNPYWCVSPESAWEFDAVHETPGGKQLYIIRYPYEGSEHLCLSVNDNEGGDTENGDDVRLESCEAKDDALWWRHRPNPDGDQWHIHHYIKGHADLCLEPDSTDILPPQQVQLWSCGSSDSPKWNINTG